MFQHARTTTPLRKTLAVAAIAFTASGAAVEVDACSCTDWPTFDEALAQSVGVFSGQVTQIEIIEPSAGWMMKLVVFDVEDCWKGVSGGTELVLTEVNEAVCGYPFEVGQDYLVFASSRSQPSDVLYAGLCWRTQSLGSINPDVDALGPSNCTVSVETTAWGTVKQLFASP